MSAVSVMQVARNSLDMTLEISPETHPVECSFPGLQRTTASSLKQSTSSVTSDTLDQTVSTLASSTEPDSGYGSTSNSGKISSSFTDGIVLPESRLLPRKITHLKEFDHPIAQLARNRFKDLSELFSKELYRFVNKGSKTGIGDISMKLKVLGESETTARPWVVVQCRKDVEKKVRKFFRQREVMSEYQSLETNESFPSFKILVRAMPPTPRAATHHTDIYTRVDLDLASLATICGLTIKANQPGGDRIATIGGIIKVVAEDSQLTFYGVTAGHIVREDPGLDLCDNQGSDVEEGSESDCSYYSDEEDFQLDLAFDDKDVALVSSMTLEDPGKEQEKFDILEEWSKVGYVSLASQDTEIERNADWALISIENSSFYKPNLLLIQGAENTYDIDKELKMQLERSDITWNSTSPPTVVLLSGIGGTKRGTVSAVPSFLLISPGEDFISTYDLKLADGADLQSGDSGSWVVDSTSLEVYGHVVASDTFREAHVIPLSTTFGDIKAYLKAQSVCLPTIDDLRNWSQQHPEITPKELHLKSLPDAEARVKQRDSKASANFDNITSPSRSANKGGFEDLVSSTQNTSVATVAVSTTLEELAHLVRLSSHQERKHSYSRIRLHRHLISTALFARFVQCRAGAYETLVAKFRSGEKAGFATLYNNIVDLRESFDANRRNTGVDHNSVPGQEHPNIYPHITSFLDEIPQNSRECMLDFITKIRTDSNYLADHICGLTPSELSALTVSHRAFELFDFLSPPHSSMNNKRSRDIRIAKPAENILSIGRHNPLTTLIHMCFHSTGRDSEEDIRRTDIWATICAKLISDEKHGNSARPFISEVLSVWTSLREWHGRNNMELYLMKILQDGDVLLDMTESRASYLYLPPRRLNSEDSVRIQEFCDKAVEGLFQVINSSGGIPEGFLELGNAILRKLDPELHEKTKIFFVSTLISQFYMKMILLPESYGMMLQYHITEHNRQMILYEVALGANRAVRDVISDKNSITTPTPIKASIENILKGFGSSGLDHKRLFSKTVNFAGQAEKIPSYLVISPADLFTLVNALFPEKHTLSNSLVGLESDVSSVYSVPSTSRSSHATSLFSSPPSISTSISSINTTSWSDPLEDRGRGDYLSLWESMQLHSQHHSSDNNQTDLRHQLRAAIVDIGQALGADAISGECHPCAERWAIVFITPDGQSLSTRMMYDPDDEIDESSSSDSDDTDSVTSSEASLDLDKSYHELRDTIFKLVQNYNVPQYPELGSNGKRQLPSQLASKPSKNPYLRSDSSLSLNSHEQPNTKSGQQKNYEGARNVVEETPSVLLAMLQAAEEQCLAQLDFVNAHLYWKALNQLDGLSSENLKRDGYASLLTILSKGPRESIQRSISAIAECEAWLQGLTQTQERYDVGVTVMSKQLAALRDKMWYATDVRYSQLYENAQNCIKSLISMASSATNSPLSQKRSNLTRTRNFLKEPTIMATQVTPLLGNGRDSGSPNKLSDEQSDITVKWLSQFGIENFCQGEERIHRFCLEIDTCVTKLVGDTLFEHPALWSSGLFQHDKRALEGSDFNSDSHGESRDYFGTKVYAGTQRYNSSGTKSKQGDRTGNLLWKEQPHIDKQQFLLTLKNNLTGLLLSDLTTSIFGNGSETDQWMSSDLAQGLIENMRTQREEAHKMEKPPARKQNISQDLSSSDKHSYQINTSTETQDGTLSATKTSSTIAGATLEDFEFLSADNVPISEFKSSGKPTRSSDKSDFPWKMAFLHLLKKFELYPNPHAKLDAIYELRCQVSAFLALQSREQGPKLPINQNEIRLNRRSNTSILRGGEGVIDKYKELHLNDTDLPSNDTPHLKTKTHVSSPSGPVNGDRIVNFLLKLLKDSNIRPKTLFRDLQFIASFIPSNVLDKTERGKAFWDIGLAALSLKQDICRTMIETADEIVSYYAVARMPTKSTNSSPPTTADQMKYTLKDSAKMFVIAAKDGDAQAKRELAIFYLTHPELVERVIAPFSKPSEVFKRDAQARAKDAMSKDRDAAPINEIPLILAHHWMKLAAQGGDNMAQRYLRQNEV